MRRSRSQASIRCQRDSLEFLFCYCTCLIYCSGSHTIARIQAEGSNTIVLKAMGRAINKGVTIAEILKRKMPLHQVNSLSSVEMIDVFEPLEEGLDVVTSRRYVSCMKITLSRTGEGLVLTDIGYQPPLPHEEIHPGDFHPLRESQAANTGAMITST